MRAVLVLLLATFCGSNALSVGDCAKSTAIESLDLKKLEGKWYEFSSFGKPVSQRFESCFSTTISAGKDGKSFVMANDRIMKLLGISRHMTSSWTLQTKGEKVNGDLNLQFKLPLFGTVSVPFKILGTDDYKSYIIFNACFSVASIFNTNLGFIFTRKNHYEAKELETLYAAIDETLNKNGLKRSQFYLSNQIGCKDDSSSPASDGSAIPSGSANADVAATSTNNASEGGKITDNSAEVAVAASEQAVTPVQTEEPAKSATSETPVQTEADKSATSETPVQTEEPAKSATSETPVQTEADKSATSETPVQTEADKSATSETPVQTEEPAKSATSDAATSDSGKAEGSDKQETAKAESDKAAAPEEPAVAKTD